MSLIKCDKCDAIIDSDEDPDCFIENLTGHGEDYVACERCREYLTQQQERIL